jgi:hypothetical protein
MAECVVTKYYGISPEAVEDMPLRLFCDYLNNIPAVERLFNGGDREEDARMDGEYEHPCNNYRENGNPGLDGENVKDILRRHGVNVPAE